MMNLYYMLVRCLSPFALVSLRLYSKLTKKLRARVVIVNDRGEVLLVRHALQPDEWSLPGGGVKRHERADKAAQREVSEELGLRLSTSQLDHLADYEYGYQSMPYKAVVFYAVITKRIHDGHTRQRLEIAEIDWFQRDTLPLNLSTVARLALADLPK